MSQYCVEKRITGGTHRETNCLGRKRCLAEVTFYFTRLSSIEFIPRVKFRFIPLHSFVEFVGSRGATVGRKQRKLWTRCEPNCRIFLGRLRAINSTLNFYHILSPICLRGSSTTQQYSGPAGTFTAPPHSWSNGINSIFRVRGKRYMQDRIKVPPGKFYLNTSQSEDMILHVF